ncbi:MAG: hypothetical protein GKS06_14600 [Acidobacteria bacterium]|nr:hypothetical protein [Acidobacteriota bacterium]
MRLWFMWVVGSTLAFAVGGREAGASSLTGDLIVIGYLALAGGLLLAGALQSVILRTVIAEPSRWLFASAAAVAAIGVIVFGFGTVNRDLGWVLGVVGGWILLGTLQWLVLRDQLAGSGWWVLAHAAGLIVAAPVVGFATWATGLPVDGALGGALRWLAFGAGYGAVTGTALLWLLRDRVLHVTA